jgi:hypothetical protein
VYYLRIITVPVILFIILALHVQETEGEELFRMGRGNYRNKFLSYELITK